MTTTDDMAKTIHQGRNIKRFREMLGLKQEALAYELGDDWTQKKGATCKGLFRIVSTLLSIEKPSVLSLVAYQSMHRWQQLV